MYNGYEFVYNITIFGYECTIGFSSLEINVFLSLMYIF